MQSMPTALLVLFLIAGVGSVEIKLHVQSAVGSATHATALAHALKSKRMHKASEVTASLRGVAGDANALNDDDDDDDDDNDDDDTDTEDKIQTTPVTGATPTEKAKVSDKTLAASTALYAAVAEESKKAAEVAAEKKKEQEEKAKKAAEAALNAAARKQAKAEKEIKYFNDDEAFDAKIAEETKIMTNETQSPALASFLGSLRSEMRQYAMPAYPKYLQGRLEEADKKVAVLEAKLDKKEDAAKKAKAEEAEKAPKEAAPEKAEKKAKITTKAKTGAETEAALDAKEVAQAAGETWAISFFAQIALLAVVFAMASAQDQTVKNYTWFLIDQVTAIFLAVMYFNAFDSLLDFHGLGVQSKVWCSILHAIVMLAIVLGAAIALKKQQVALAILCGAGAHIVSFSSIHAAAGAQNSLVGMSYTFTMCIFGLGVLGLAFGIIGYLVYTSKKRLNLTEDDAFMDKTDDLENDFGAMAFSVVFTMFMRFVLTGHHPVDDDTDFDHTRNQRTAMFFYAIACLIVAGFVVNFCSKKAADPSASYTVKRVMGFITSVATMNVAWAWLYWGEWQFFEALYPGEAIKGRVMFAIVVSLVGALGIVGLSKIKRDTKPGAKSEKKVALVALSLLIAWSWELCFDAAVETMCEGVAHPVWWKVGTTLTLAAIIVPVYAIYMKPITTKAAEAIGA